MGYTLGQDRLVVYLFVDLTTGGCHMLRNTFSRSGSSSGIPATYGIKRSAKLGSSVPGFSNSKRFIREQELRKK